MGVKKLRKYSPATRTDSAKRDLETERSMHWH